MRSTYLAIILAVGVVSLAGPATAQKDKDAAEKKREFNVAAARAHGEDAQAAEKKGQWKVAAREWGVVFEITHDPKVFAYIGEAYLQAKDCGSAMTYFQRYLKEADLEEGPKRDAEKKVADCKKELGEEDPVVDENTGTVGTTTTTTSDIQNPSLIGQPGPTPVLVDQPASWKKTAAWATAGLAIGLGVSGAVLGLAAQGREDDLNKLQSYRDGLGMPYNFDTQREKYNTLVDEGDRFSTLSVATLGAAGGLAAISLVFFILDSTDTPSSPSTNTDTEDTASPVVQPTISRDGVGVAAAWEF